MAQDQERQPGDETLHTADTPDILGTSDTQNPYSSPPLTYVSPEFYEKLPEAPSQPVVESSGYTVPTPKPYQPSQVQYGVPSNYGHGSYAPTYSAPPYFVPQPPLASPLPLGQAIRELPAQYWRVLTHPSGNTFAKEMGKARWNIVWVQIIFYIVLTTLTSLLSDILLQPTSAFSSSDTSSLPASTVAALQQLSSFISLASVYGQVIIIPLSLFVGTGILFLIAKAFGGTGTFLRELYCTLLFLVPLSVLLNVLTLLLAFLSTFGSTLSLLLVLGYLGYEGTLLAFLLIPVHRLSGSRATGAVLLFYGVAILLTCVLGFMIALVFAASTS